MNDVVYNNTKRERESSFTASYLRDTIYVMCMYVRLIRIFYC
jgi:hypothetical protein